MSVAPRGRSLYWTISGVFLLAVGLGTLLQALVADAVLRPLEARDARARAETLVSAVATELEQLGAPAPPVVLDSLLALHRSDPGRPAMMILFARDGSVQAASPSRLRFRETPPGETRSRPASPLEDRDPGGRPRFELLARRALAQGPLTGWTLGALRPNRPQGLAGFASRTTLLFLPIAGLAALLAGLVVVRLLVRRLRGIEALAARVTEGDLSARISDPSLDEIGRLAGRLDRMADRLSEARAKLEATDLQRRQLFADITHELATPLTSIRGYAETLLDPSVRVSEEERRRYVSGVLEESRRLDRLIRDLFVLARLEAGATPLEREPLDWAALCVNTVERFMPRFRDAGLGLEWHAPLDSAWIHADGHRMEEVLENLLGNALRYVPAGGKVRLGIMRADGVGGAYRMTVSDDGPGVAAEDIPHVFERFYRGSVARPPADHDERGSGLGLAIVREIVERHGGTVRAEAMQPSGLALSIEIPALEQ